MYETLIDVQTLTDEVQENWVIVDCRFNLVDPAAGRLAYRQAHIPGAVYAHLDDDLSGPPVTDAGRHPLPTAQALRALFSRLGIGAQTQVVVYDSMNGALASRLWWMLRYMGHTTVAVLDGGWQAWQEFDLPVVIGEEQNSPQPFLGRPQKDWLVLVDDVAQQPFLVDSRAPARFRGELEPLDIKAGHIPGAINFFYQENWGEDGRYRSPAQLQTKFEALLGKKVAEEATFYCGSGVTACANLLALAHAGLGNGRLYIGSWSDWITDNSRPVAIG